MCTSQKYDGNPSRPNLTEQTANQPVRGLKLSLSFGMDVEQVYEALCAKREKLNEEAALFLAAHDVDDYLHTLDLVENIDFLVNELVFTLNQELGKIASVGTVSVLMETQRKATFQQRREKLLEELNKSGKLES